MRWGPNLALSFSKKSKEKALAERKIQLVSGCFSPKTLLWLLHFLFLWSQKLAKTLEIWSHVSKPWKKPKMASKLKRKRNGPNHKPSGLGKYLLELSLVFFDFAYLWQRNKSLLKPPNLFLCHLKEHAFRKSISQTWHIMKPKPSSLLQKTPFVRNGWQEIAKAKFNDQKNLKPLKREREENELGPDPNHYVGPEPTYYRWQRLVQKLSTQHTCSTCMLIKILCQRLSEVQPYWK